MNSKLLTPVIAVVAFILGLLVAHFIPGGEKAAVPEEQQQPKGAEMIETRLKGGFRFISPLLECDNSAAFMRPSIRQLEAELKTYVTNTLKDDDITDVSVYYRDLNNGPWMGIGINKPFSPASLLKVPVMIAALHLAERDKGLLQRRFKFDASVPFDGVDPNILDEQIQFGKSYTYLDLIERMIVNSDNNAKNLLVNIIGDDDVFTVWDDLGIPVPTAETPEDFLTVRDYSSFFRILYNATYLSKEMSELGLDILSRTRFDVGLESGLPDKVMLSNKFGERGFAESNLKQLHDCGIVYADDAPYLICVMTRGYDWQQQADIIAEVSRRVYEAHVRKLSTKP